MATHSRSNLTSTHLTMSEQQAKKALKKEGRRNAQNQKMAQKNKENAEYFWRCAQAEQKNRNNGRFKKPSEASKESLFARQESSGINFSQVTVTRLYYFLYAWIIGVTCHFILNYLSMRKSK